MQFLKVLFWCLLAFVAALFTYGNWTSVPIRLWSGLIADMNLPLLVLVTFLLGYLPTTIYHHAVRWRLRQRLTTMERLLIDRPAAEAYIAPQEPFHPAVEPAVAPDVV